MNRTKKPGTRCVDCLMRIELCLCEMIAACRNSIQMNGRVDFYIHHKEIRKSTNTGRIAYECLKNFSSLQVRGHSNVLLEKRINKHIPLLYLFPHPEAKSIEEVSQSLLNTPYQLIVPDGNWRQAAKVAKREGFHDNVTFVGFKNPIATTYQLRKETHSGGMATMEAVAHALGFLESPSVRDELLNVFNTMVRRTLRSRLGQLVC